MDSYVIENCVPDRVVSVLVLDGVHDRVFWPNNYTCVSRHTVSIFNTYARLGHRPHAADLLSTFQFAVFRGR